MDTTEFNRQLGAVLRATRMARGLSLKAVADRFPGDLKVTVLGSYERGHRAIHVERLAELAAFYGVAPAVLIP